MSVNTPEFPGEGGESQGQVSGFPLGGDAIAHMRQVRDNLGGTAHALSIKSSGPPLITEETRRALLSDLNLPEDANEEPTIDKDDETRLHPFNMARNIYLHEIKLLISMRGMEGGNMMDGREVAQSFGMWARSAFDTHDLNGMNSATFGEGLVFRAFRLQFQWPFTERLATLPSGQVLNYLQEDRMTTLERHAYCMRVLHNTEVPYDQIHLKYVVDRLASYAHDPLALADGAGAAYRVISRAWLSLVPPEPSSVT